MLLTTTVKRVEEFWAQYLGCSVPALQQAGVRVLGGARCGTIFVFKYRDACVWHVHNDAIEKTVAALNDRLPAEDVFTEGAVRRVAGPALELILGPCPIGYCDAQTLQCPADSAACRQLKQSDGAAVEQLARDCGSEAWEHGGVELASQPAVFGCFEGARLLAAASYETWGQSIAHVGVVTAPDCRRRGLGRVVAVAATANALRRGLVPQWRTLASNLPSLSVGRAIGYQPLAAHYFVRLRSGS